MGCCQEGRERDEQTIIENDYNGGPTRDSKLEKKVRCDWNLKDNGKVMGPLIGRLAEMKLERRESWSDLKWYSENRKLIIEIMEGWQLLVMTTLRLTLTVDRFLGSENLKEIKGLRVLGTYSVRILT